MRFALIILAGLIAVGSVEARPRPPRRSDDYQRSLRVGQRVYNVERDSALVEVVAIETNGRYVIRYIDGVHAGQTAGNWNREALAVRRGCVADVCTGDTAYNTSRESVAVRIVGIQHNGKYVIEFNEGVLAGKLGGGWDRADLAVGYGCSVTFCVGDRGYNVERESAQVEVIAIGQNGKITLNFTSGVLAGKRGGGWDEAAIARTSGCSGRYCVGDEAILPERQYVRVKVIGIQANGKIVLEFLEGVLAGKVGAGWDAEDLAYAGRRP